MSEKLIVHLTFPLSPRDDEYLPFPPLKGGAGPCEANCGALASAVAAAAPDFSGYEVASVRLDGAAPSMMSGKQFRGIMRALHKGFALAPRCELSLKVAPLLMSADLVGSLDSAFRLNLDLDFVSAVDRELKEVHALYRYGAVQDMMELVRCFNIGEYGFDVRYGLYRQTPKTLVYSLDAAIDLGPTHLTLSPFAARPGSRCDSEEKRGELPTVSAEARAELLEAGRAHLAEKGFEEYAPGRFALPGHRVAYWDLYASGCALLGAGLGARSAFEDMELLNTSNFAAYVASPQDPAVTVASSRILAEDETAREKACRAADLVDPHRL